MAVAVCLFGGTRLQGITVSAPWQEPSAKGTRGGAVQGEGKAEADEVAGGQGVVEGHGQVEAPGAERQLGGVHS